MGKQLSEINADDIEMAFQRQNINENNTTDVVYIEGIPFKNVHQPLDEYAASIGAVPYSKSKISKFINSFGNNKANVTVKNRS